MFEPVYLTNRLRIKRLNFISHFFTPHFFSAVPRQFFLASFAPFAHSESIKISRALAFQKPCDPRVVWFFTQIQLRHPSRSSNYNCATLRRRRITIAPWNLKWFRCCVSIVDQFFQFLFSYCADNVMNDKILVLLLCVSVLCDFAESAGYHHLPPVKGGGGVGLRVTRTSGGYPYNLRTSSSLSNMTKASVSTSSGNFMPMKTAAANATKTNSSGPRTR